MKPEIKIRNWSTVAGCNDPYRAPETIPLVLRGDVEDHPALGRCNGITTSKIIELDLKGRRVETYNTIYFLDGPPDERWVEYLKSINYDMNKLPE